MTLPRLLLASLCHYGRTNLAVLLGVAAATAVIGGALVVGDSVRASLTQMSLDRLGGVDHALSGGRFFREDLAAEIQDGIPSDDPRPGSKTPDREAGITVAPAIVLSGALSRRNRAAGGQSRTTTTRAGDVAVYGVDHRFWPMTRHAALEPPQGTSIVLNRRAADSLGADIGDEVSLIVEIPASIPRDALLGEREETVTELVLTVSGIAGDDTTQGRFGLNPSQQLPLNAFVALDTLQDRLGLAPVRRSRENPVERPARINTLFAGIAPGDAPESDAPGSGVHNSVLPEAGPVSTQRPVSGKTELWTPDPFPLLPVALPDVAAELTEFLHGRITLQDLALRIVLNESRGYFSLESEQMILEDAVADAGRRAAHDLDLITSPVLVYLINEVNVAGTLRVPSADTPADPDHTSPEGTPTVPATPGADETPYSMYPVAAGVEFTDEPPFGPFEYVDPPATPPGNDDVIINDWLAADLGVRPGDQVRVKYHVVGDRGELPEEERTFRVAGIVKRAGPADDRGLTPDVPGITDVESFGEWRQPFPIKLELVTDRDDEYWEQFRATPKLFLSLHAAQELWRSRYGQLTSLRVAPRSREQTVGSGLQAAPTDVRPPTTDALTLEHTAQRFERHLLAALDPHTTGLVFQPVKHQGVQAAQGTTDFAGLFIAFSFFLILAAALLIGLLFRLGIERRLTQIGLLSAVGLSPQQVRRLFLAEGAVLILIGGVLGTLAAVGYAALMIQGLRTWWIGAIGTRFLFLAPSALSLAIGFVGAAIVALLAIGWGLRSTRHVSPRELLAGATEPADTVERVSRRGRVATRTTLLAGGFAVLLLALSLSGLTPRREAFGGFSWQVVAFFLVGVAALVASLSALAAWLNADRAAAVRGAGLAAMGRLGLRNAARHRGRSVMTAGLIAAATFVIVAIAAGQRDPAAEAPDPRSGNGGFTLVAGSNVPLLFDLNTPGGRAKLGIDVRDEAEARLLESMRVMPFRVRPGEDASCLNLYRTQLPTILGVPRDVIDALTAGDRFKFANTPAAQPWTLLDSQLPGGRIPVLGDMNTLQYSLHKSIGDTLDVPLSGDPQGSAPALQISGMLDSSVFQGVLLMSADNFLTLFPEQAGFRYFLIEVDPSHAHALSDLLETELADFGFDVERVADRLASFLAVQNTYLSTFQTLGGLGLLLGTLGLATVMLRNVLERRGELALLRAVGFRNANLAFLVLWENACLMLWGLAAGAASALLAMTPHLLTTGADVPWRNLWLLLAAVFLAGMLAALAAVREAVRTPILATLRGE